MPVMSAQAKEGKVTPIAVTSAKRSAALPNVPTIKESGYPDYEMYGWFGILAPPGTPRSDRAEASRRGGEGRRRHGRHQDARRTGHGAARHPARRMGQVRRSRSSRSTPRSPRTRTSSRNEILREDAMTDLGTERPLGRVVGRAGGCGNARHADARAGAGASGRQADPHDRRPRSRRRHRHHGAAGRAEDEREHEGRPCWSRTSPAAISSSRRERSRTRRPTATRSTSSRRVR